MTNLRVFYHKTGRAKYISHLDITRCMQRAIKRAGLPVWYTEGFNPHIYLTFALPLSLGYESESESMDFRLTEELPMEEVCRRLDEALPPDIHVVKVDLQKNKPDAITAAVYEIRLTDCGDDSAALLEAFHAFLEQETICVEKKTKKGMKTVDIKPDCQVLSAEKWENGIRIVLRTAAGPSYNINPTLLTDEFLKSRGIPAANTQVLRKSVLMENGQEFE